MKRLRRTRVICTRDNAAEVLLHNKLIALLAESNQNPRVLPNHIVWNKRKPCSVR